MDRRQFIVRSAAASGSFALGWHLPIQAALAADAKGTEVNAWVIVNPDDTCVIRVARSEMGSDADCRRARL